MAIGDSSSILLKIKGDATSAVNALHETAAGMGNLEGSATSVAASLAGPLALAASTAAAGFVVVAANAIRLTSTLYDLSKAAAEYGSKIYDASQKTGLHAEALTALKYAAEQSGSSFEQVTKGVILFGAEVGKAAEGDDKAAAKMKLLGVTSDDLRTALGQAVKTIYDAKTSTEQLTLASDAFGRKIGPDLIPLIKDAHGNLDELEKKAKELGITLTDEDVEAADKFGDTLDQLNDQFKGLTNRIGIVFMPVFTDMAEYVSGWLKDNQGELDEWSRRTKTNLTGASSYWQEYYKNLQLAGAGYFEWLAHIREALGPLLGGQIPTGGTFVGQGQIEDITADVQRRGKDVEARRGSAGLRRVTSGILGSDADLGIDEDTKKKTKTSIKHASDQMRKFFEDIDFTVTDQDRKAGTKVAGTDRISKHSTGEAVDLRTRDKSVNEIVGAIAAGLQKGFRFYDERLVKGQPHLHVEANTLKPSTFIDNPALYGGAENLAALKALDAERVAKKGGSDTLQKQVEDTRKAAEEQKKIQFDTAKQVYEYEKSLADKSRDEAIARFRAESDTRIETVKAAQAAGDITDAQALEQIQAIRLDQLKQELDYAEKIGAYTEDENKAYILREQFNKRLLEDLQEQLKLQQDLRDTLNDFIEKQQEGFDARVEQLEKEGAFTLDQDKPADLTDEQIRRQDDLAKANDNLTESWHRLKDAMAEAGDLQMAQIDIQQQGLDLIDNMEGALENAIERWLLYGESVGKALKQALAAELAHVAARCAIKALEATADGFFFLATGQFAAATAAFTAAAYYAAVAVGAGLAAKALAPKQQQKPAGAPSAGAAASQGTRGGNAGEMYSGKEDYTAIIGRNTPEQQIHLTVDVRSNDSHIVNTIVDNANNNGKVRAMVREHSGA